MPYCLVLNLPIGQMSSFLTKNGWEKGRRYEKASSTTAVDSD